MFLAFSSFSLVSMALLFLNAVFSTLGTLFSFIIGLLFTASACAFVLMIQALKVPGDVIQTGLQAVGDAIKACLEYLLDILLQVLGTAASSFFDLLKTSLVEGLSTTGEVIEKLRNSSEELSKELLQVSQGLQQMISKIVEDLWKNYMDAVKYVIQNA
ncbi:hypothetical protein HAX54_014967 [Datura stramonium]|uniref:Uncharacterized protein n=1 Tax=Datura stramonium TaxID=4076 RepID=A0ABS8Y557_DATST|nr:hypothetical protein [Datura stramonium]